MKNMYDIKKEKNLNFILPMNARISMDKMVKKTAIIIHLHYLDTIEDYIRYITYIPEEIDIFITTSNVKIYEILERNELAYSKKCQIIKKPNRGRDISSFLVTCRKYIVNYEYIGFVHDKKEKQIFQQDDIKAWIQCLWENMLGSEKYIANVLDTLDRNQGIGLLVPPPPMGEYCIEAFSNSWYEDFALTRELATGMQLKCDLNPQKPPLTLGTAFWAKVSALKKLFEIEWQYDSFDEEPLKNGGTISHAIERILSYVAQDAGYETGWIMTDHYAGMRLEYMRDVLEKSFDLLASSLGISNIKELTSFEDRRIKLLEYIKEFEYFYIYGAGVKGKQVQAMLKDVKKIPKAFLVSDGKSNPQNVSGIPVYTLKEISLDKKCGIIVAVSERYQDEIIQAIKDKDTEFADIYIYQ